MFPMADQFLTLISSTEPIVLQKEFQLKTTLFLLKSFITKVLEYKEKN